LKVALDTNVLVYAEGVNDAAKRDTALNLVRRLPQATTLIPVQALGELFNVLTRKAGMSRGEARERLLGWHDAFPVVQTTPAAMLAATDISADHQLGIWDALVLSISAQAGCRLLLSEDMQEGFTWGGVTVTNPFAANPHTILKNLLNP